VGRRTSDGRCRYLDCRSAYRHPTAGRTHRNAIQVAVGRSIQNGAADAHDLVSASNGVDVDISLALPGYEDELFERAAEVEAAPGVSIRLCSAEDLVILKAVAGRPLDVADIEGVVARQGKSLDASYIRRWLNEFANVLARPEISERFDSAWNR